MFHVTRIKTDRIEVRFTHPIPITPAMVLIFSSYRDNEISVDHADRMVSCGVRQRDFEEFIRYTFGADEKGAQRIIKTLRETLAEANVG